MKSTKYFKVHEADQVAVALCDLPEGVTFSIDGNTISLLEAIPAAHKFALQAISLGQTVTKYGYPIGKASKDIPAGAWIHTHNLETLLSGKETYRYEPAPKPKKIDTSIYADSFLGYQRSDGRVGIRNEIWIIPTVSCANNTAVQLAQKANALLDTGCDGIFAFPHNAGCSQLGQDHITTQKILANIVKHPNAGAVLLLSLGCENNNLDEFLPFLDDYNKERIRTLNMQNSLDEYTQGMDILTDLSAIVSKDKREAVPANTLALGFKCGGSDAFSGITANPLCGRASDILSSLGGTGILSEVPEMFGAEQSLMSRADTEETYKQVVSLIDNFKQYFMDYNQPIYENPSPGNRKGGITTNEEKSLGCVLKGGNAPVTATLEMGEHIHTRGLNLLNGPGNDNVSITNLMSSGAQIILFTTGTGNPLGTTVPCIKISSNTTLTTRKPTWIDFNAGKLLDGTDMDELAADLWPQILDTASGKIQTKNETYGQKDIMIFKNGVLL